MTFGGARQHLQAPLTSRGSLRLQLAQPPDIRDHRQQAIDSYNGRIPVARFAYVCSLNCSLSTPTGSLRQLWLAQGSAALPGQFARWTWIILCAITQLRLARALAEDHRLPWERRRRPGRLTPGRVRRGFARLAALAGQPAETFQSRPRPPQRPPQLPSTALRRDQQGRLTRITQRLNAS